MGKLLGMGHQDTTAGPGSLWAKSLEWRRKGLIGEEGKGAEITPFTYVLFYSSSLGEIFLPVV